MATVPKGKRADLPDTREALLSAATHIFAEKGYTATTIRQICAEANVNVALVNYHFSSKEDLYRAVKYKLYQDLGLPFLKLADDIQNEEDWQLAIRTWVERVLALATADKPPASWAARMLAMEHVHPSLMTPEIDQIRDQVRAVLIKLIRMGTLDSEKQANLWANALTAQCLFYIFDFPHWLLESDTSLTRQDWVDQIRGQLLDNFFASVKYRGK